MAMMDTGGAPPAPIGGGGQVSQEEASYRNGNPIKHCGLCLHYTGGSCEVVAGDINPHMVSNEYDPYPNPLKEQGIQFKLKGSEVWRKKREERREETGKGTRGQAKLGPDKAGAKGGKLSIGRKEY